MAGNEKKKFVVEGELQEREKKSKKPFGWQV